MNLGPAMLNRAFSGLQCAVTSAVLSLCITLHVGSAVASDAGYPDFSQDEKNWIMQLGPWPVEPNPDPGNELSGKIWAENLGAVLFHERRLSKSGEIACVSCHHPNTGYADGTAVAVGNRRHVRNTQGLWNAGLQTWFGWDGGADSLWAASLRPLMSELEMASDVDTIATRFRDSPYVQEAVANANPAINIEALSDQAFAVLLSKAIAAFTRTLISPPTQFDQFREALLAEDGAAIERYPPPAQRGLKLFIGEANCVVCHFGPTFSNGEFHDIGRPFFTGVGQVDSGRYNGIQRVRADVYNLLGPFNGTDLPEERRKTETVTLGQVNFGQWRTPSLRNLASTAPYMHDGSLATLEDVVDMYNEIDPTRLHTQGESLLKPLELDAAARSDLVHFLSTLSKAAAE